MASKGPEITDLTGIMVDANLHVSDYLIILPVLIPMLFSAILLMMRTRSAFQGKIAVLGMGLLAIASFGLLQQVLANGPVSMTMGRWVPPFGITFSVDIAGALLTFTSALIALVASIYASSTATKLEMRYGFYPFFMAMMCGVSGAFLTGDVFNLYVWFEVLLISSFGMIVLGSEKVQLDGTMKYAFLNLVATTMFLMATGYLYGITGSLNMADIWVRINSGLVEGPIYTIAVLYFLAFAMKAASFPMNFWLPASYHTPKFLVSALFAGLLTKVGIYALLRISVMLFADQRDQIAEGIAWIAALTMITGVMGALAQNDIRRVFGYLVVSGIGTMLAGIAIASVTGVSGVLVYAVHSMIVMTALYLAAGFIGRMAGTNDLRQLGGLYAASPMFAAGFLILALSVAGLPPTSGFWGKFILVKASLEIGAWWLAAAILISGLLTSIAVFRVWIFAFWRGGPEGTRDGAEAWKRPELDESFRLTASVSIGLLVVATLAIGLAPEMLISISADGARMLLYPNDYIGSVFGGDL
ncbi:MAG: Na+/H+ antiporter subunit D [Salaquimonas sp.]